MSQAVWESIYGRLGYLQALQSRAYRQIYGVPGRIGADRMERRLGQEAANATRLWESGQISKQEALRRQKRAYDIIGMLQEIGGDKNRGGTESDFYKIAQEIKDLTRFVQPGKNQRNISEYAGPLYNPDQLKQMGAFSRRHRLGAERMDPNERGYAPLTTPWSQLNDDQKEWRKQRNLRTTALYDRAIEGLFDERDGRYTRTFDFGPFKLSPSAYGNRLFTKPVGPPTSTTGSALNSGTKKALEGIKKIEQTAPAKMEDKTEPESGSTAITGSPLERLKKIMAKESTNQPVNKPEDTYKQTTFHAQQAREKRRDPFTGGRETF